MLTAFVQIHAVPDRVAELATELADVEGVSEVYSVTGDPDLVVIVRVREHERLAEVVTGDIARHEGIVHTTTMVAYKAYSRHDLDAVWGLGVD